MLDNHLPKLLDNRLPKLLGNRSVAKVMTWHCGGVTHGARGHTESVKPFDTSFPSSDRFDEPITFPKK